MVMPVGATGGVSAVIFILKPLKALEAQGWKALTRMLSVVRALLFDEYLNRIVLDEPKSPESTVTPLIPPKEVGICHAYPVALLTADAVYRNTR